MNTGDILLFSDYSIFSKIIRFGTRSEYSHVAIVLKDPHFIHPEFNGVFVWDTYLDNTQKTGIHITPIEQYIQNKKHLKCTYRKLSGPIINPKTLCSIYNTVKFTPYDVCPMDWIEALLQIDPSPKKIDRFWCSALIGYIYTICGIINEGTDWSLLIPKDFSIESNKLQFKYGYNLGPELNF